MTQELALTIDDVLGDDDKFWDLLDSVPFDNSAFQTQIFVANKIMPARMQRQLLLELHKKAEALRSARWKRDRTEIELRMKREEIAAMRRSWFARWYRNKIALMQIDIDELEFGLKSQMMFVKDALHTVSKLLDVLAKCPRFTREEFEAQEPEYWQNYLMLKGKYELLQTGRVSEGTLQALHQIGHDPVKVAVELKLQVNAEQLALEAPTKQS